MPEARRDGYDAGVRRKLFTLCSAVSLLLCVGVWVLWVRSYRVMETVQGVVGGRGIMAQSLCGVLHVSVVFPVPADAADGSHYVARPAGDAVIEEQFWPQWRHLGILPASADWQAAPGGPRHERGIRLRLGLIATCAAGLPFVWLTRRRHHARPGLCLACGYDLRATPNRCPECGAAGKLPAP
jgi:hypothetical protein